MIQLLDLARENAALRYELQRVRREADKLRGLLGEGATSSVSALVPPEEV
jgi:hypothetical protein